jgi:hypothetical protein
VLKEFASAIIECSTQRHLIGAQFNNQASEADLFEANASSLYFVKRESTILLGRAGVNRELC